MVGRLTLMVMLFVAVLSVAPAAWSAEGAAALDECRYALEILDRIIAEDPFDSTAYELRGDVYAATGRLDRASEEYELARGCSFPLLADRATVIVGAHAVNEPTVKR